LYRASGLPNTVDRHPCDQPSSLFIPGRLFRHWLLERDILASTHRREPSVVAVGIPYLLVISELFWHGSLQSTVQTLSIHKKASGKHRIYVCLLSENVF